MKYHYKTINVCPKEIIISYKDLKIIDLEFLDGGCPGNLNALKKIIIGMSFDEVIKLFEGNQCGMRKTSCMDQLAKALNKICEKEYQSI